MTTGYRLSRCANAVISLYTESTKNSGALDNIEYKFIKLTRYR